MSSSTNLEAALANLPTPFIADAATEVTPATAAAEHPIRIRALGALSIEHGDRRLRFGRKLPHVPLALLKLLMASGEPIPAGRLSAALWPGYRDSAPRGTLDTAIYRLRRLLGHGAALERTPDGFALARQVCWTDTGAFALTCERIGELARRAAVADTDPATVDRCERALLSLYRGPFGADDDPPPVARAREQLRRRFARAIAELERLWLRLGEGGRRAELVQQAVTRDDRPPILRIA
jgi:LuxR family transcriptional regulator, maltose regulon positive regulatory protein